MKVPVIVRSVMMSLSEFPKKKYQIIYCDPAWDYRDKAKAGKRGSSFKYDVMKVQDIMRLPVWDIADNDCVLFMWATAPLMQDALDVIKAWDFTYKTFAFVWTKRQKTSSKYAVGMGNYSKSNAEYVLVATRGHPKVINDTVKQIIVDTPRRRHSQKPDRVRTDIVKMYGDVSRIELFARTKVHGWDVWGNDPALSYKTLDDTIDTDVN